jgi:hypothetical protein
MTKKIKASKIKINLYSLLSEAVETGLDCGENKALKYSEGDPTIESLKKYMYDYIMLEISELIDFEN